MTNGPTIQRARELLGSEANGLTDAQVEELLASMKLLADIVIDNLMEQPQTARQKKAA